MFAQPRNNMSEFELKVSDCLELIQSALFSDKARQAIFSSTFHLIFSFHLEMSPELSGLEN